jgi:ribosomal protein L16 Arg81 hydroxylase
LIVQVEGNTRFEIWDIDPKSKLRVNIDSVDIPPIIDVVLSRGDIVYVPAYFLHRATSKTKRLSISFPSSVETSEIESQDREWLNIEEFIK